VVFDKSAKYYHEYSIPESEKPFTRDFREVRLNGVRFPSDKPLVIASAEFPNPTSPYEALANFLSISRTGDLSKVIALHDSTSRRLVETSMNDPKSKALFFKVTNTIQMVKVVATYEAKGMTVVHGFNVFADREVLHPWVFVKEKGRYMKKAGAIDLGFLQSLGVALQSEGVDPFKGKK